MSRECQPGVETKSGTPGWRIDPTDVGLVVVVVEVAARQPFPSGNDRSSIADCLEQGRQACEEEACVVDGVQNEGNLGRVKTYESQGLSNGIANSYV
jgi:hypothetical protein